MQLKKFKLRDGVSGKHFQDGEQVQAGDEVELTPAQANAMRDKFEAVDDGDFQEVKDEDRKPYKPSAKKKEKENGPSKEEAPQGAPVAQPPVPVRGEEGSELLDPTALDPAKQGQRSREQQNIIDSGNAPLPATATQKDAVPKEEHRPAPATATAPAKAVEKKASA